MRLFRRRPVPAAVPPLSLHAEVVLDQLATTYAAHPDAVAALLLHAAGTSLALDAAAIDPHAADHDRAMAAAEADAAREALLTYCTTTEDHR